MSKWIKFTQEYDGKSVGEICEYEDATADTLVKTKHAEISEKPSEVDAIAGKVFDAMNARIDAQVKATSDSIVEKLLIELKPKGGKDRRPRLETQDNEDNDPKMGFKHIGEFAHVVARYCQPATQAATLGDERVKRMLTVATKAPTSYANEAVGADGGFLLPPDFANTVLQHDFFDESLMSRTDKYQTASNNLTIPKDETTPWGTAGIQVAWTAEAGQLTQTKPKLGQENIQLHKLTALVPVTDEQLQDSFVGLGQYITRQAVERIMWAVDDAIVNGTGAGKPLGILNSGALVQQAAESSQTAATINLTNIFKMISRIPFSNNTNLVWLIHPSAFPQIGLLTNGNTSLFVASGAVQNTSRILGSLFGIPVIISQHSQAIGTPGDIMLFDMSKYLTLTKGDGVQTAMSMHLFFDYNISTFRFNYRVGGQPWLQAAITSAYGNYSMSPFVDLASR